MPGSIDIIMAEWRSVGRLLLAAIACLGAFSGGRVLSADASKVAPPVVLVVVNGDAITAADLDAALVKAHSGMDNRQKASFDYRKLLTKLVNDRLILQEAEALGLDQDESLVAELERKRTEAARRLYIATYFRPDDSVSEAEVRDYFGRYYWKVQVRTLASATEAEAQGLRGAVEKGASMDSLARALSLDSRRFRGGLHNLVHWADVPIMLRESSADVKEGQLSQLFRHNEAYSFLRVEKRVPADTAELPAHRKEIEAVLRNEKRKLAWQAFVSQLKAQTPVVVDSVVLAGIRDDLDSIHTASFQRGDDRAVIGVDSLHLVTEGELRRAIAHAAMRAGGASPDSLLRTTIETKTENLLLAKAAERGGFVDSLRVETQYRHDRDSALIELYLKEMVISHIKFNHEEFETYYRDHPDRFRQADEFQLATMIIDTQEKADSAAARLNEGADWTYVASQFAPADSLGENSDKWVTLSVFNPAIADDLAKLRSGQTSQAHPVVDGWAIFKVKERRTGILKSLEEADAQIREIMFQKKFGELLDKRLKALAEASRIEYKQAEIDKYFGAGS